MSASIDFILPVYNPSKDWAKSTLAKKAALETQLSRPIHLIISDDGSEALEEYSHFENQDGVKVIRTTQNRGKGHALREGMKNAKSEIILFTDADFPYDDSSMYKIIQTIEGGADIALGYRERDYYASVPWFRKWLSEAFRFVLKSMLRFPITDTQCGLKAMNQHGKEIFLKTSINRFLVDMEFIKLAVNSPNIKIEPVVVQLRKGIVFSKMGVKVIIPELFNFFRVLVR